MNNEPSIETGRGTAVDPGVAVVDSVGRRAMGQGRDAYADPEARAASGRCVRAVTWLFGFAIVLATLVRIAPLLEGGARLQRQCITEDGYLMLTIARNIALGNGFSIADGAIATNGTQPLSTVLFAACYAMVGGDRLRGLYPVVGLQIALAMLTALALYYCMRHYLYRGPRAVTVACLAAALWFISPSSLYHSQNGLETGLYALMVLVSCALYDAWFGNGRRRERDFDNEPHATPPASSFRGGRCLALGAVLGLTFLTRNDAVFLIAGLLAVHLVRGWRQKRRQTAFAQSFIIGAVSVLVASPWLYYNVRRFGHLGAVSGRAESFRAEFADNFPHALVALVENATVVLRIPGIWERSGVVQWACGGLLLAAAVAAWLGRRWLARSFSPGVGVLATFLLGVIVYYALFFGMPGFLGRYFFSVVTLAAMILAAGLGRLLVECVRRPWIAGAIAIVVLPALLLDVRIYRHGKLHPHTQVIEWVAANVPDEAWVGATQTGTLGYYHDRTINLDGKVNPYAFAARQEGRIGEYAMEVGVAYIVDWAGHAKWASLPAFSANYELILVDEQRNLAVLKRRS